MNLKKVLIFQYIFVLEFRVPISDTNCRSLLLNKHILLFIYIIKIIFFLNSLNMRNNQF